VQAPCVSTAEEHDTDVETVAVGSEQRATPFTIW
jgi:hypothetical protein